MSKDRFSTISLQPDEDAELDDYITTVMKGVDPSEEGFLPDYDPSSLIEEGLGQVPDDFHPHYDIPSLDDYLDDRVLAEHVAAAEESRVAARDVLEARSDDGYFDEGRVITLPQTTLH